MENSGAKKVPLAARKAALLSFVFNGLGQIYNGEIKKGLWLFFGSGCSLLVFLIGAVFTGYYLCRGGWKTLLYWGIPLLILGIIGLVVIGAYSIVDAFRGGKKLEDL